VFVSFILITWAAVFAVAPNISGGGGGGEIIVSFFNKSDNAGTRVLLDMGT